MKILLHTDEFVMQTMTKTSKLVKIATHWKDGYILKYRMLWLPLSQIISQEKVWIDKEKGEFYMIYELPDWYCKNNNLEQYAYRSAKNFDIHVQNIKKELGK